MDQAGKPADPAPVTPAGRSYDVAIVGGGYSGLWTAYYLKRLSPGCSVCVLESRICGFGASGRNGGWLMAALAGETRLLSALDGSRLQRVKAQIHGILPEVEAVIARHDIDCAYRRGGGIYAAARYPEQARIQREHLQEMLRAGFSEADYRWMDRDELASRLQIRNPLGGIYTPHIARIHPGRLVRGLAENVRALGVDVYEGTPVLAVNDGALATVSGPVVAPVRVLATEGYAGPLAGARPRVLPVQSRIVATEPLNERQWQGIGLADREVFCEASPLISYGQRSADDRLVFGSRGSYRFWGKPRSDFTADGASFSRVQALLLDCFPQLAGVEITHCWGGTLGAPRSGRPHAVYDPRSGLATLGGYYGEGVGASNLMARTLADLILERDSELANAPWAHRAAPDEALRRWEPEPLRWLGYKATDLVRGLEEAVYRREGPRWLAASLRRVSALLDQLRH